MKSFIQISEEQNKKLVMLFGRMNPPTKGHEENVNGMKSMADKIGADHLVVASHSVDAKKNPLTPDVKLKHLQRSFPNTNITASSKEKPTIMHAAADAHAKGYSHLVVVAGADRVPEYERLLNHYNGKKTDEAGRPLRHGYYNFKKIEVRSTGERKKGISGTDMRNHVSNNDFNSFKENLATPLRNNLTHARELFRDVRKGMGLQESTNRGLFKAIFVVGGPGSGKDIVIRESIYENKSTEMNCALAVSILNDKHKLSEHTRDVRREAIRNRYPLIINATTNEESNILCVKEELEDLGYETLLVFVNTTNESSKKRNETHSRILGESIRFERWQQSQLVAQNLNKSFNKYIEFDNSLDLNNADFYDKIQKEEDLTVVYEMVKWFLDTPTNNEISENWLIKNNKYSIDKLFEQIVDRTENTPMSTYGKQNRKQTIRNQIRNLQDKKRQQNAAITQSLQTLRNRLRFEEKEDVSENQTNSETSVAEGKDCTCGTDKAPTRLFGGSPRKKNQRILDNICPSCQLVRKQGKQDSVTDGDVKSNSSYIFRTYVESSEPTITRSPEAKETRFQQDADKIKAKKQKTNNSEAGKVMKVSGVSPEYDTRGSGTVYPMSGLGTVTYKEQKENKYTSAAEVTHKSFKKFRKEAIDSPSPDMGVTGTAHGPTNKEPMETLNKIETNPPKKRKK